MGALDLQETALPILVIRKLTQTDDSDAVSDEAISLYRSTAFELYSLYTGKALIACGDIQEPVILNTGSCGEILNQILKVSNLIADDYAIVVHSKLGSVKCKAVKNTPYVLLKPQCSQHCDLNNIDNLAVINYRVNINETKTFLPEAAKMGIIHLIQWFINNKNNITNIKKTTDVVDPVIVSGAASFWDYINVV